MTFAKSPLTTHVLDTAKGIPAVGLGVTLEKLSVASEWQLLTSSVTNQDGRVVDLINQAEFHKGFYRLIFATGPYHRGEGFFPQVSIHFEVKDPAQHHHVPLLLSPFGYSTYRGS